MSLASEVRRVITEPPKYRTHRMSMSVQVCEVKNFTIERWRKLTLPSSNSNRTAFSGSWP
jgi:hypothetical protein